MLSAWGDGSRAVARRYAIVSRSSAVAPPSAMTRWASARAASTYVTSFIRLSAWSGVLVRVGCTTAYSRVDASKAIIDGGPRVRFWKV